MLHKRLTILLLFTFLQAIIFAQSITQLLDSAEHYTFSNYSKSIFFATKASDLARIQNNDTLRGKAILKIGIASYLVGKHDEALSKYFEAEKIFIAINNKDAIAQTYNEIGILYIKNNKIDQAKQILTKAITLKKNTNINQTFATSYNNLGRAFEAENNIDSAEYFYKIALKNYYNINDSLGISYSLDYLSSIYIRQQKYDEAERNLLESIKIKRNLNDKTGQAIAINNLGELYFIKEDYKIALSYFKSAQESAKLLDFTDLEANTFKMQAAVYEKLNDYKNAFYATQQYNELNKKILDDKRLKNIEEFEAKYDTEKKENKIIQQNLKISRTNILLFALFIILILTTITFYLFYNRRKLQQEKNLQEQLIKAEEKRSKAIIESEENERQRLARELHDGVGQLLTATKLNLSTLSHFDNDIDNNKFKNSLDILDDSIKEIRNISHNMVPDVLLKFGLQKAIENFINRINQTKKININFECNAFEESKLDNTAKLMLYRIIQESVNNTIKYADATVLNIIISADEMEFSLMIEDNGKGFDIKNALEKDGIGLKNIQIRTDYLKGKLEIDSSPQNGTTIIIEIPLT